MTITVDSAQFRAAVTLAASVVARRNTIPVLGALRATANGALVLEGSDLDSFTRAELPYSGEVGGEARFCLPQPLRIAAMVKAVGGETVEISARDAVKGTSEVFLQTGTLRAALDSLPADDHPGGARLARESWGVDLGAGELRQIARLFSAISKEEARYYLNGLAMWHLADWTFRFAATDGHRLMLLDLPLPGFTGALAAADGTPVKLILPRRFIEKACALFAKTREPVRFSWGPKRLTNEAGVELAVDSPGPVLGHRVVLAGRIGGENFGVQFAIGSQLIDGIYPDVMRVVPPAPDSVATFAKAALVQAIRALQPLSGAAGRYPVKLTFVGGEMTLALAAAGLGSGTISVPCESDVADGFSIGFNAQYLLDALAAYTGDTVVFQFTGGHTISTNASAPTILIDPADTAVRCVLMPMRV